MPLYTTKQIQDLVAAELWPTIVSTRDGSTLAWEQLPTALQDALVAQLTLVIVKDEIFGTLPVAQIEALQEAIREAAGMNAWPSGTRVTYKGEKFGVVVRNYPSFDLVLVRLVGSKEDALLPPKDLTVV